MKKFQILVRITGLLVAGVLTYLSSVALTTQLTAARLATQKWDAFATAVGALNSLDVPFSLHGGTLLDYYRDCRIATHDMDIVIPLTWRQKGTNEANLIQALQAAGFNSTTSHGVLEEFGYETNWVMNEFRLDIFSIEEQSDHYVWGLWVYGNVYECYTRRAEYAAASWNGLDFRVPVPIENALMSNYGTKWNWTYDGWIWDREPFSVGSCTNAEYPNRRRRNLGGNRTEDTVLSIAPSALATELEAGH